MLSRKPRPQTLHLNFSRASAKWNFLCFISAFLLADIFPQIEHASGTWMCLTRMCSRRLFLFLDLKSNGRILLNLLGSRSRGMNRLIGNILTNPCICRTADVAGCRARAGDVIYAYLCCLTHCRTNRRWFADLCRDRIWCATANSTVLSFCCNAGNWHESDSVWCADRAVPVWRNFRRIWLRCIWMASADGFLWSGSRVCIRTKMLDRTCRSCKDTCHQIDF